MILTKTSDSRAPRSPRILWRWTAVSAGLHALLIALLCTISYFSWHHKQAAAAAKASVEKVTTEKASAEKSTAKAQPEPTAKVAATPGPSPTPAPVAAAPVQAEKVLGIDQVATPNEIPKSPFASSESDLLKDLK